MITIDDLPEGYDFYQKNGDAYSVEASGSGINQAVIELRKKRTFPLEGEYSASIKFVDAMTKETISDIGLDCVLYDYETGEEIFSWNTSENSTALVEGLKFCFEDENQNNKHRYAVKTGKLPENYSFYYGGDREEAAVFEYSLAEADEYLNGTAQCSDVIIYLADNSPDAPKVTYLTGSGITRNPYANVSPTTYTTIKNPSVPETTPAPTESYPEYSVVTSYANADDSVEHTSLITYVVPDPTTEITCVFPDPTTEIIYVVPDPADEDKTELIPDGEKYGDVSLDGTVNVADIVTINLYLLNEKKYPFKSVSGKANADCMRDNIIDSNDSLILMNYVCETITADKLGLGPGKVNVKLK